MVHLERQILVVFGALAAVAIAGRADVAARRQEHARRGPSPELRKSDKTFYAHDYPDDFSPTAKLEDDFDHPYPIVQDTDEYDRDFVRDENSDGGEWKMQEEYDALRSKLEKLRADEKKAYIRKRDLERRLAAEKAKRKAIRDQERNLEKEKQAAAGIADGDLIKAEEDLQRVVKGEASTSDGNAHVGVGDQTNEVTHEVKALEDCKKELMEAQAKLKKLQEERLKAQKDIQNAKATEKSATKEEFAKQKAEAEAEKEVAHETELHTNALKIYSREAKELKSYENDLARAEARLRKFRRSQVDQDGGVFPEKSFASSYNLCCTFLLIAVSALLASV